MTSDYSFFIYFSLHQFNGELKTSFQLQHGTDDIYVQIVDL